MNRVGKVIEAMGPHKNAAAVGIVGAGPAGLTLAQLLKERVVTSVVILEKAERVGGKSRSRTSWTAWPTSWGRLLRRLWREW